jgi:hypothetical protein
VLRVGVGVVVQVGAAVVVWVGVAVAAAAAVGVAVGVPVGAGVGVAASGRRGAGGADFQFDRVSAKDRRSSIPGNLAMLTAIRRASSRVSSFAAARRPASSSK